MLDRDPKSPSKANKGNFDILLPIVTVPPVRLKQKVDVTEAGTSISQEMEVATPK